MTTTTSPAAPAPADDRSTACVCGPGYVCDRHETTAVRAYVAELMEADGADMVNADAIDVTDLRWNGDEVELEDGRTIRLRIESDTDCSVNDFDCYGRVAWVERDKWTGRDLPRPAGFTGRARKLQADRGDSFWWEPYEELRDADVIAREADLVRELVTFGFKGVVLELCEGSDAYGRPIVVDTASLWGIDSVDGPHLAEVVSELVAELG